MFEEFIRKLRVEISKELPGGSVQKLMAPLGRRPLTDYMKGGISPKMSAVLILVYPGNAPFEAKTVFIIRSENEAENHAGQVAFPGGGFDRTDHDLSVTALREAEEEIGVERNTVTLLGALTPLYIPVSNYMVHPFVGAVKNIPGFRLHPLEVKAILEVNIRELVLEKNKGAVDKYLRVKNTTMKVPCYNIRGEIIWGATAMIVSEFEAIIKRAIPPLRLSPKERGVGGEHE